VVGLFCGFDIAVCVVVEGERDRGCFILWICY
jgi:hypothetical protein